MKRQRFSIGQKVTPRNVKDWAPVVVVNADCPLKSDIYSVKAYSPWGNIWLVLLAEIPHHLFEEAGFEPVIDDAVLEQELKEIFEPKLD